MERKTNILIGFATFFVAFSLGLGFILGQMLAKSQMDEMVSKDRFFAQVFETCRFGEQMWYLGRNFTPAQAQEFAYNNCVNNYEVSYHTDQYMIDFFAPKTEGLPR